MTASSPVLATVTFHGHDLVTVHHEGQIFVALKPIVEAVGLAWHGQFQRIKRDDVLNEGIRVIGTPSEGGEQQTTCLPLKLLNGWLFGIDTARIKKPEVRAAIIQYKRECYDVLHAYWTQGEAVNPRFRPDKTRTTLPGGLSIEQQDAIKALVKSRAEALPHDKQGSATRQLWSSLKSKFGVTYKEIPPEHFTAALSLVARVPLSGELMPPEAAPRLSCIDILKINLSEEAKHYGCDPTVPMPDDIRADMEGKAWELARQTYDMSVTFMTRTIAYSSEMGLPRRVDPDRARNVIDEMSLELVVMNKTIGDMKAIRLMAGVIEGMAADFNKQARESLDGLMMRIGLAA